MAQHIQVRRDPARAMRALFSWDPFRELSVPFPQAARDLERDLSPAFDVKDTAAAFVFQADVPGIRQEDIQVQMHGTRLTISGKREAEEKKQQETYYAYERSFGSFARTFTLPETADVQNVSAELNDGVLTVRIPKRASEHPRNVQVKSGRTDGNVPVKS